MRMMMNRLLSTAAMGLCLLTTACSDEPEHHGAMIEQVTSFDHQVTGVAVSKDKRMFVNFPRWTEDAPVSVAEVTPSGLQPFPDADWNSWRLEKGATVDLNTHFICVQSVVMDHHNNLWVLDSGAPKMGSVLPGAAKLVKVELASNQVSEMIIFDEADAPQGSYLNDVRFSRDDHFAYVSDSGRGGILVVDLNTAETRRVLDKDPSVLAEKGVVPHADGKELRKPDGSALIANSDGITLSVDSEYLYWQALSGKTLYKIPVGALIDEELSPKAVKKQVERVGENGVADGLWMDNKGMMYISSPEDNAIKTRTPGTLPTLLVQDARLRWPDSFAEGPDGTIYVTASHIQDSAWFKPDADKALHTELFKIIPAK